MKKILILFTALLLCAAQTGNAQNVFSVVIDNQLGCDMDVDITWIDPGTCTPIASSGTIQVLAGTSHTHEVATFLSSVEFEQK